MNTTAHCIYQRLFHLAPVEPEDDDLHPILGFVNSFDEGLYAVSRLYQQSHGSPFSLSLIAGPDSPLAAMSGDV
jgi:hypothetical protein